MRCFFHFTWLAVAMLTCGCAPVDSSSWESHTQGLPFVIGYEAGMAQARDQQKPALVFFTTHWCGVCQKLASHSFTDPQVRALLGQFSLVLVDGDRERAAVQRFGVPGYPCLVVLADDGEPFAYMLGYMPPEEFAGKLRQALRMLNAPLPPAATEQPGDDSPAPAELSPPDASPPAETTTADDTAA